MQVCAFCNAIWDAMGCIPVIAFWLLHQRAVDVGPQISYTKLLLDNEEKEEFSLVDAT